MTTKYRENRVRSNQTMDGMVADIMRHYHARQYLGMAVILTDEPETVQLLAQKHWAKLSRALQQRRGRATNPIDILKYTYTIASMQHLVFSTRPPQVQPEAQVYILRPQDVRSGLLPVATIYSLVDLPAATIPEIMRSLMNSGLFVNYVLQTATNELVELAPRSGLELSANLAWHQLQDFLAQHGVADGESFQLSGEAMEDAVDRLLGMDVAFLAQAATFQRALDLARPLITTPKRQRDEYETFIMLAHRVQTFASSGFSPQFLHTYASDDFLLGDHRRGMAQELLRQIQYHLQAGRFNLARALQQRLRAAA